MPLHETVEAELESMNVGFEEMDCDPDLADTAAFCEAYDIPMENSANAILVASRKPEGEFALCVVLATDRLDVNGTVRKRMGVRKASFAPADVTLDKTGQEIGGVTVFGIPPDIPIWVDSKVLDRDWVIVGAGTRTAKVKLAPRVFETNDRFEVVEGLSRVEQ